MEGNKNYYAILMAGGVGSRFWPVSTTKTPKQFLDILGVGESLIQTTFRRLAKFIPHDNIYILTNKMYREMVQEHLPEVKPGQIVLEPEMRNTAPSILLGALKIRKKNKDAVMVVAPSDHWIQEQEKFIQDIQLAFKQVAEQDKLICLGITPTFPNTGYGYIKYEKEVQEELKPVLQFTEKPNIKKAQQFLEEGNYVWNAGIFVWSANFIVESFNKHLPEMFRLFKKGEEYLNSAEEQNFLDRNYGRSDNISIDYGIMEKSDKVFVIPVNFGWNDLGTWGSLQQELPQDEAGNTAVNSRLFPMNSAGNIVRTAKDKIVVLDSLDNFIVVESEDVLLIMPKEKEQDIKKIREEVMDRFGENMG